MFENYSKNPVLGEKMEAIMQKKLTRELHDLEVQLFEQAFDFSIDLDNDIRERMRLLDGSDPDLFSAVKKIMPCDVCSASILFDEHLTKIKSFETFRKTGEQLRVDFDYYSRDFRFEFRVLVVLPDDAEMVSYEVNGAKKDREAIAAFMKNSLIIFNHIDRIIAKYHC